MRKINIRRTTIIAGLLAVMLITASPAMAALTVQASHDNIEVDYNYHGGKVSVSGETEPGTDIIVKISAPDSEQSLMRKDKVAGVLWMNVEKLHFKNIPGVYLLKSTKKPGDILSEAAMHEKMIGYSALESVAGIEPEKDDAAKHDLFEQFIKYKEANKVYSESEGGIEFNNEGGLVKYSTEFSWPFQAPPGQYFVTVYAVKDGAIADTAESTVKVAQVGSVKLLADMARDKGGVYGAIAIVVALAAGFGVGMIFGKGGGAH